MRKLSVITMFWKILRAVSMALQTIEVARRVVRFFSSTNSIGVNEKVDVILDSGGLIRNVSTPSEERYYSALERGLQKSALDPHITAFVTDLMRVCPSPEQYRLAQDGLKKELHIEDVTNSPWVQIRKELVSNGLGGFDRVTNLVVYVKRGVVEPGYQVIDGERHASIYLFGSNRFRFIRISIPQLGAFVPLGEPTTMENLFYRAALSPAYGRGERVPVRIMLSRGPYVSPKTQQIVHAAA